MDLCLIFFCQNYVEAGSVKKTQQRFQNVTNPPLLAGDLDQKVLGLLCVPELHLLLGTEKYFLLFIVFFISLGVVDKIMNEFENRVFVTKKAGKKWMDSYLKKV